jgi:glycosyltransferase involved in cell wall biosynthesis
VVKKIDMTIGICALGALSQDTGGRTYLTNLSKTLQKIDQTNTFVFFMSAGESHIVELSQPNFRVVEISHSTKTYQRIFSEHFSLPFLIRKHKIDTMYYPGNFASYFCPVPYVLAIRSMLVYNPEAGEKVSFLRHFYRKFLIPHSAKKARHVITPSQHTKDEIVRFLRIDGKKVSVIPHGIDTVLFGSPKDEVEAENIFQQYGIKRPFILYVSALWEYKNQDKLILAFSKLIKEKNIPHLLILIGRGMSAFESYGAQLKNMITELNLSGRVIFIDFLPHKTLKHFYQFSDVYVFPSLMESFGNSLFEAMAAGAPVVCSNSHGFPILVKDAAVLADPRKTDELADAIHRVLSDPELRTKLLNNGKSLADSLSWDVCVKKSVSLILTKGTGTN